MTMIGFIRHGSTSWNKEKRAQGSSDIPLDQDGLNEADKLAERLKNEKWDVIYSSNLSRAKQTAEIIGSKLSAEVLTDSRLREVSGGQMEGTTEKERIAKWGSNWRELDLGVEPSETVLERGLASVEEIRSAHPGKNVLIVSHGSFIRHILKELVPHVALEPSPRNTSVTKLTYNESQWDCELYNCTVHLDV